MQTFGSSLDLLRLTHASDLNFNLLLKLIFTSCHDNHTQSSKLTTTLTKGDDMPSPKKNASSPFASEESYLEL